MLRGLHPLLTADLRCFTDMAEELGAMKREYGVVAQQLARCCNFSVDPVPLMR